MRQSKATEQRYQIALELAARPEGVTATQLNDAAYGGKSSRTAAHRLLLRLVAQGELEEHNVGTKLVYRIAWHR
jgi:Fe2+ or Zn2+ uptake regulation protein